MTPLRFYNLEDAFSYQRTCPLCKEGVRPVDVNMKYGYNSMSVEFIHGSSTFEVDIHSGQMGDWTERSPRDTYLVGSHGSSSYTGMTPTYGLQSGGVNLIKMEMACHGCEHYRYVVQVHVSLDERRVVALLLNSESVTVKDGVNLTTIKNVYTTGKTEYIVRVPNPTRPLKKAEFPLIPLNMQEPVKTLERIKKLIVFL